MNRALFANVSGRASQSIAIILLAVSCFLQVSMALKHETSSIDPCGVLALLIHISIDIIQPDSPSIKEAVDSLFDALI